MSAGEILALLPKEFDVWRPKVAVQRALSI
jgi:hypothetical protein